jgi:CRISPR/Cas system-associated exonuclease Cas4 (RecB family)
MEERLEEQLNVISASQVLLFSRCPYALYLKLQTKEETQTMLSGTLFHRLVELRLKGYSKEEAIGIATEEFVNQTYFPEAMKNAIQFYTSYEKTLEQILDEGVLTTEKKFTLEIDGITIVGYIDFITLKRKMIELKSTRYDRPLPEFKHIFQLSVYALTEEADEYYLHYVFPNKVEIIKPQILPRGEVVGIIKSVAKLLEAKEFPPLGMLSGYCQFCAYKKLCKYYDLTYRVKLWYNKEREKEVQP